MERYPGLRKVPRPFYPSRLGDTPTAPHAHPLSLWPIRRNNSTYATFTCRSELGRDARFTTELRRREKTKICPCRQRKAHDVPTICSVMMSDAAVLKEGTRGPDLVPYIAKYHHIHDEISLVHSMHSFKCLGMFGNQEVPIVIYYILANRGQIQKQAQKKKILK